jgi:hypothetical protein
MVVSYEKCLPESQSVDMAVDMWQIEEDRKSSGPTYEKQWNKFMTRLPFDPNASIVPKYNAFAWTCEHFVVFCKTNNPDALSAFSIQTDKVLLSASEVLLSRAKVYFDEHKASVSPHFSRFDLNSV